MYSGKTRSIALVLLCAALVPALAMAETEEDRLTALETRVETLEAQVQALLTETEPSEEALSPFEIGEKCALDPGRSMTITAYETGTRFKYSPASGFSTLALSAKTGYRLLCLYVTVQNNAADDLYTATLLDTVLLYGGDYANKAQDSFFYRNSRGAFAGGLMSIRPQTQVEGCLLFAVPEDIDTSRQRIAVQFNYGDTIYECELRGEGTRLESEEPIEF